MPWMLRCHLVPSPVWNPNAASLWQDGKEDVVFGIYIRTTHLEELQVFPSSSRVVPHIVCLE